MSAPDPKPQVGIGWNLERVSDIRVKDYLVRFAFGAGVSMVATLVAAHWGPRVGGVLLAFPAILPASLTLIEREDGRQQAVSDARGGQLGGLGLVGFGVVAWVLLPRVNSVLALSAATACWTIVAVGGYLLFRHFFPDSWGKDPT